MKKSKSVLKPEVKASEISQPTETKENIMSTTETTPEVKTIEAKKIEKTYRGFNLGTLKLEEFPVKFEFSPATETADALNRLSAGLSVKELLEVLNSALESRAASDAKKKAIPSGFASRKVVMDFIKSYRISPTFSGIVTTEKGKSPDWKNQYNLQTEAILGQILNVSFIMDNLKAIAAISTDDDDSDE